MYVFARTVDEVLESGIIEEVRNARGEATYWLTNELPARGIVPVFSDRAKQELAALLEVLKQTKVQDVRPVRDYYVYPKTGYKVEAVFETATSPSKVRS